jgi:hypothetical protein
MRIPPWSLKQIAKLKGKLAAFEPKLTVELIPRTTWGVNVRSMVSKDRWDVLRRMTYRRADYTCEVCGGVGEEHPVECHEVWGFDYTVGRQFLQGLIALCPNCHMVKHIGYAEREGRADDALIHLAQTNNWNWRKAMRYLDLVFEEQDWKNSVRWRVDISLIDTKEYTEDDTFVEVGNFRPVIKHE